MGADIRPSQHGMGGRVCRGLFVALLAGALSASPAFSAERHYPDTGGVNPAVDAEGNCYNCHSLDPEEGALGTSFIQRSTRTMVTILQKGAAPDHLGCTFCHYSITSTTVMKEVFSHFSPGTQLSMHPIGKRFDNGADTDGEYFSNIDGDAANDAYQLDCVDCHDPALLARTSAPGITSATSTRPTPAARTTSRCSRAA